MKKIIIIFSVLLLFIGGIFFFYGWFLGPVSNYSDKKKITINEGSVSDVADTLKSNNLIRSTLAFKLYVKLNGYTLKASTYTLSEDMSVHKIVDIIAKGNSYNPNEVKITFKEGVNIRQITSLIVENTTNSESDIYSLLKNQDYLDSLIEKYWFITSDIKNSDIYYPLEGYLFPDTYIFLNNDVTVQSIFEKMLDEMNNNLSEYKDDILNNSLSVHELLTFASLIELEGVNNIDRENIAGVFKNRIDDGWTLGSDVTTYYANKIDNWSSLTQSELNNCNNKYNTRCPNLIGLPVGPIASPSIESIKAALYPKEHDYYYFVADCDKKIYLTRTSYEHQNIIAKLENEGKWCG